MVGEGPALPGDEAAAVLADLEREDGLGCRRKREPQSEDDELYFPGDEGVTV
jgi:hypothetical protein